jgi:hypothetical protein
MTVRRIRTKKTDRFNSLPSRLCKPSPFEAPKPSPDTRPPKPSPIQRVHQPVHRPRLISTSPAEASFRTPSSLKAWSPSPLSLQGGRPSPIKAEAFPLMLCRAGRVLRTCKGRRALRRLQRRGTQNGKGLGSGQRFWRERLVLGGFEGRVPWRKRIKVWVFD